MNSKCSDTIQSFFLKNENCAFSTDKPTLFFVFFASSPKLYVTFLDDAIQICSHFFCANLKRLRMQRGLDQNSKFDPSLNLFSQTQASGSTLFCLGWKSKQIAIFQFDYTFFQWFFSYLSKKKSLAIADYDTRILP